MSGFPLILAFVAAIVLMILAISKWKIHPFLSIMGISRWCWGLWRACRW